MVPETIRMSQCAVHIPGQGHGVHWALFYSLNSLQIAQMVSAPGTTSWCLPPKAQSLSDPLSTSNDLNFLLVTGLDREYLISD